MGESCWQRAVSRDQPKVRDSTGKLEFPSRQHEPKLWDHSNTHLRSEYNPRTSADLEISSRANHPRIQSRKMKVLKDWTSPPRSGQRHRTSETDKVHTEQKDSREREIHVGDKKRGKEKKTNRWGWGVPEEPKCHGRTLLGTRRLMRVWLWSSPSLSLSLSRSRDARHSQVKYTAWGVIIHSPHQSEFDEITFFSIFF